MVNILGLLGIQVFAAIFGLFMIYLTYFYFKRKDLSTNDFILWLGVWLVFLWGILFPENLDFFMYNILGVISVVQLFTIFGFMFFSIIIFYMYKTVRKSQRKLEQLVKSIAIKEATENGKTRDEH